MKNSHNTELAVCGFAAVKTLEKNNQAGIKRLYFNSERAPLFGGLCKKMAATKRPYNQVTDQELEKICQSVHHQGVVAFIDIPEIEPLTKSVVNIWAQENERILLLDRIGNANNLGAIIRSAAFFGIRNIVIPVNEAQTGITTSSYRVAEGGMEFVNVYSVKSIEKLLVDLKDRMLRIGTSLDAQYKCENLASLCRDKGAVIVLGNEEHGISDEVRKNCDAFVIIPYAGMSLGKSSAVDSLNVAQAASIIMYEMNKEKF